MSDEQRTRLEPPDRATVEACVGATLGALTINGARELTETQAQVLDAIVRQVLGHDLDWHAVAVRSPAEANAGIENQMLRTRLVQLMVVLEMVLHPLPVEVEHSVERYAHALHVPEPMMQAARQEAHRHAALMYADIYRNSWYTEETRREILHGHLWELVRSKAAYTGIVGDHGIYRRWHALGDLPRGTWGREVFEFYRVNGFPLPGARHGISEVSARHDWIHVLAGYPATPEGEIDVFTFIAAAMDDPSGFTLLVTTLALFQDYSIRHVAWKRVKIARADTLADPGAPQHLADAMRRGLRCRVDPMSLDQFAHAARPLDELRAEWDVAPRRDFLLTG